MRTIKDPKKKPDVRRRTDLDAEEDDTRSTKRTPPKKRRAAKPKDDGQNDVADNQSDIVSERSSMVGDDDASDVSSLKSTPPKKRNYKLTNRGQEMNGDVKETKEVEKKTKSKRLMKKEDKNEITDEITTKESSKKISSDKKSPKGKRKITKPNDSLESDKKASKTAEETGKVSPKTRKASTPVKKGETKSKSSENQTADNADTKSPPKRKRKLSGPTGEETDPKEKKLKGKKEKVNNDPVEVDTPPPKSKFKAEKKLTKKQILKEQAQLELKRQTEEQRNAHSDKVSSNNDSVEAENKTCETQSDCHKASTPKKKALKSIEKEKPEDISEVHNHVTNKVEENYIPSYSSMDNATKAIEEVSKIDYVLSIPDDLRSDEDDDLSDLDTSFESINSVRTKLELADEQKIPILDSVGVKIEDKENQEKNKDLDTLTNGSIDGKTEINIKCDNCGYISKSKGGHTRHLRKCQPEKLGLEGVAQKAVKLHRCEKCDYCAPRRVLVINHMKVHGIFQCKRCTYRTDSEENLDDHSGQEHKDRSDCKFCKLCNRYVKCSEIPLEKHMEECQGRVPFKCPECSKEFQYESSLKCHVVSHYPDQPKLFSCDQCDYKSNYKANLKKHIRHIHEQRGEKSIQCPQCEKCFHTEDNMRRHQKLHSPNRPHKCDQEDCDKAFKTYNGLKLHMISHQTERPFTCDVDGCTKGFKTNYALGKHINEVHQNAPKNFKCEQENCTMAFYKKYHLERHMEAHKDNRNTFFCTWPTCSKAFKSDEIMKSHLLIHTDEKPLKCEHCDYVCRQKSSIRFHMKKKHPELLPASDLKSPKSSKKGNEEPDNTLETADSVSADLDEDKDMDEIENDPDENVKETDKIEETSKLLNQRTSQKDDKPSLEIHTESSSESDSEDNDDDIKSCPIKTNVHKNSPSVKKVKEDTSSNLKDDRTNSIANQIKDEHNPGTQSATGSVSDATASDVTMKKPKKTDMYEFQSEDESEDDMKPGLLRKGYDKDKPPLPSVTSSLDPSVLSDLNSPAADKDKDKDEGKDKKPTKVKKKPGPKPKPKQEKPEPKSEKPEPKQEKIEPEVKQPKKRGRKKKSEIEKEKEKAAESEEPETKPEKHVKPKGKRGRSPKVKKAEVDKESSAHEDGEEDKKTPVKKKRGPKKKVKEEKEKVEEKIPKKRGRKKKVVKEEEEKKKIEPENGDATINYSEVESSEMFADSKDGVSDQTPDVAQAKDGDASDRLEIVEDIIEEKTEKEREDIDVDPDIDCGDLDKNSNEQIATDKVKENAETVGENNDNTGDNEDKKSSDLDSDSSDIGSDFDEDLKPPPAPRPPPMYDSEDGDIESGPENEDFNGSAMSNEPLRDFESSRDLSREISRDFESSPKDLNDSVKTSEVHSVETLTPKDLGTPSSVNPLRIDSVGNDYDNQETPYPHSHHSSVPHTPSHNSIPPTPVTSQEFESHGLDNQVRERMIKNPVQGQTNDENTDESSMPEVDKDYVGRFFEEIQCTQTQSDGQINRINSIDENPKSQEKIVETSQSDSGVASSLTSNQTDSSLQMQSPPTDLSMKRMDILSSDRPPDEHYQPRSVGSDHRSSDNRIPSVPSFEAQYNPLDPFSSSLPTRDSILRQTEKVQSPTNVSSSFMRFPEDAMLQRQRMTTPYDRNIQNLHRITEPTIPQHNNSSPLLRHMPGREDMFPTAAGVSGSMSRNPFHSSWSGQDVRPPHWGHPTYLQRPLDQQSGSSSSSLFGKDSYLPSRDFMFDPSRAAAERNMFSSLASSHSQRPDIAHDTFQFDRFDLGSYLSSHGYNPPPPSLPVDYTRSAAGSTQKTLDERYRQSSTGVSDYRSLPQTSSSDMFGMNSSFNLDKFYPRDPVYHSQHIADNTNSRFLPGVAAAAQHSMFSRDYAHAGFYAQNSAYPFVNMNDKNYSAATAKLASSGSVGQQRELVPVPRPNMSAPDPQLQDPYRHHSSMLYNMMNRYFD